MMHCVTSLSGKLPRVQIAEFLDITRVKKMPIMRGICVICPPVRLAISNSLKSGVVGDFKREYNLIKKRLLPVNHVWSRVHGF